MSVLQSSSDISRPAPSNSTATPQSDRGTIDVLRRSHLFALLTLWLVGGALFSLVPTMRPIFVDEDSLMETATAGLAMTTALVGVGLLLSRSLQLSRAGWWSLVGYTALGLLFMLDELSWGERIFNFEPPVVAGHKRIDSMHDGVGVVRALTGSREAFRILWFTATAAGLGLLWMIRNTRPVQFVKARIFTTPLYFFGFFCLLAYFVMTLDEYAIPPFDGSIALEEMLEFSAVLTLLFGVVSLAVTGLVDNLMQPQKPKR